MKYYTNMITDFVSRTASDFNVLMLAAIVNIILGVLNIYLFIQNRKERRSRLNRDISIKESELEDLRQQHRQEHKDLENDYEGEIRENIHLHTRVDFRTENDRQMEMRLFQRQRNEESRIWAELGHLYELRDGQQGYLVREESKIRRLWNAIRRFFKRI